MLTQSSQPVTSYRMNQPVNRKFNVTCRRRASVNGCHRLLILIFLCTHIKMLMSLPEFCHRDRTPAAVVLSVMADGRPLLIAELQR
jgi:hypothetical protein